MQQRSGRKAHNMRTRYFGWEYVFEHIGQHCDRDGLWTGDAASVAADFHVSEDEAYEMLSDLADRDLIQRIGSAMYIITRWPERDEPNEE
jgi:hypothetical protein